MFNKVLNKLASLDFFGGTVTMRANNSETIKTLPGFLITLIVSVLGLAAFISLIMEMYAKENPEVYEHVQQMVSTNNTFTFDPYEFTTITYVGDSNYKPISNTPEKTYFTIQYRFCEGNLNCWFVEAQSCPDLIINYLTDSFGFSSQLTKLGYCLDEQYWSTNKFTLSGTYITENFTRVERIVEKCQNITNNAYICAIIIIIAPCQNCITTTNSCTLCTDVHMILDASTKTCTCEYGYVNNGAVCDLCVAPCDSCINTTTSCLTCTDINHLRIGTTCICQDEYYSNSVSTCAHCVLPCKNCTINGCLTCVDAIQVIVNLACVCRTSYYMSNYQCLQCQAPCESCVETANHCLTCNDIHQFINDNICYCQPGYYMHENFCQYCAILIKDVNVQLDLLTMETSVMHVFHHVNLVKVQ